ncbi:MAG: hypothetical protein HOP12_12325 [Candidatus Eisenbacteria bacterium]|uniref:VCBS repeat-containing protein n=1 Tax=Eiseniibacteriota bacterium TaxID=2212470 RepID=A0A849SKG8_UNCEI|nr:hypothetical protein [Candidatus Eisenbacteria bacterium]
MLESPHVCAPYRPRRRNHSEARRFTRSRLPRWLTAATAVALTLLLSAPAAHAQRLRPWIPPAADSMLAWSAEARAGFQTNRGDSIGGSNYEPYERVGFMARRLLRSLGRANLTQAAAVESYLDSLGLDTDLRVEARLPYFALLVVRNPYRPAAKAVAFLLWYRQEELKTQGFELSGGYEPRLRVWWTNRQEGPYAWGILDASRDRATLYFSLLQLSANGQFWHLVQFDTEGIPFAPTGDAAFADLNGDSKPEFLVWTPAPLDSLVENCRDCPRLLEQRTFVERPRGFALLETRIVPSPTSTFIRFVQLLAQGDRASAARFLKDPRRIEAAVSAGWGLRRAHGSWKILATEPEAAWPLWLLARFHAPGGPRDYKFDFESDGSRWLIKGWERRAQLGGATDSTARRPAGTTPRKP